MAMAMAMVMVMAAVKAEAVIPLDWWALLTINWSA
jgi:hypothetical protein